jgi:hypothetical protein
MNKHDNPRGTITATDACMQKLFTGCQTGVWLPTSDADSEVAAMVANDHSVVAFLDIVSQFTDLGHLEKSQKALRQLIIHQLFNDCSIPWSPGNRCLSSSINAVASFGTLKQTFHTNRQR